MSIKHSIGSRFSNKDSAMSAFITGASVLALLLILSLAFYFRPSPPFVHNMYDIMERNHHTVLGELPERDFVAMPLAYATQTDEWLDRMKALREAQLNPLSIMHGAESSNEINMSAYTPYTTLYAGNWVVECVDLARLATSSRPISDRACAGVNSVAAALRTSQIENRLAGREWLNVGSIQLLDDLIERAPRPVIHDDVSLARGAGAHAYGIAIDPHHELFPMRDAWLETFHSLAPRGKPAVTREPGTGLQPFNVTEHNRFHYNIYPGTTYIVDPEGRLVWSNRWEGRYNNPALNHYGNSINGSAMLSPADVHAFLEPLMTMHGAPPGTIPYQNRMYELLADADSHPRFYSAELFYRYNPTDGLRIGRSREYLVRDSFNEIATAFMTAAPAIAELTMSIMPNIFSVSGVMMNSVQNIGEGQVSRDANAMINEFFGSTSRD